MTKYGLTALLLCGALTLAASQSIAAETLKIGVVAPVTGPAAESGRFQVNGAKLAAEEVNKAGGVLGKQLELVIEDDQTTNPGAVLAFSKLAGFAGWSTIMSCNTSVMPTMAARVRRK